MAPVRVGGGAGWATTGSTRKPTAYSVRCAPALGAVKVIEHDINAQLTAMITEAEIDTVNPRATLRVADRFTVNAAGKIIEQENHFDPRDVTNPGWQHG